MNDVNAAAATAQDTDPAEGDIWQNTENRHYVRVTKRTPKTVRITSRPSKKAMWRPEPKPVPVDTFVAGHRFIKGKPPAPAPAPEGEAGETETGGEGTGSGESA